MKSLKKEIINSLLSIKKIHTENNQLNYNLLFELLNNHDEEIINSLLNNKNIKEKFFKKIKDIYIFKIEDFKFFLEETKINNSFTEYENKIGLTHNKKFITESEEVVLDFPYKDCVLLGGQKSDDKTESYFELEKNKNSYIQKKIKRKEIFFNQVLAHDEIDRLFDKKALVNWQRYTKKGKESIIEIKKDEKKNLKENLIIKGNNLLALHSIKELFAGKVKLIYIDPPYNTGQDSFEYNDNFNHSTWLTFMKNRLEIAKDLLSDDGLIFIQCDYNESHYLKVLMDSDRLFRGNFINEIIWKRKFGSAGDTRRLGTAYDSIFIYSKSEHYYFNVIKEKNTENVKNYIKQRFTRKDTVGKHKGKLWMPYPLANPGNPTPNLMYSYKGYSTPTKGYRMVKSKLEALDKEERLYFPDNKEKKIQEKKFLDEYEGQPIDNLWTDIFVINSQAQEAQNFDGQKPEALIERILNISTKPGDIVLDFFLGSGTTAAVAHKMGRQYIGIEQMDYVKGAVNRLEEVIKGEQSGISKKISWKGGGNFIYLELAAWNKNIINKIKLSKNLSDLEDLIEEIYEKYFLNYHVNFKEFKDKIIKEESFKLLKLNEQQKIFCEMLDLNQMYVQESEMSDANFKINKKDQDLTSKFYNK